MDWLKRMNNAMEYVETHLSETIDYDQVARIACCSTYFSADVIRRRRLTLAAFELQNSGIKVIDVAFKYGYESPGIFQGIQKNARCDANVSARQRRFTQGLSSGILSYFDSRRCGDELQNRGKTRF